LGRGTLAGQKGRIHHDLPKGTNLAKVLYQPLSAYHEIFNERPGKILDGKLAAQVFSELLMSPFLRIEP